MNSKDKIKKKLLNNINGVYTKFAYNLPFGYSLPPTMIHFMATLRCNLRCEMCFFYGRGKTPKLDKWELTLDEMERVIDSIAKAYRWFPSKPYLGITGGEPFIRRDIFEIIDYIKKKGFKFSIVSNFALLNEDKIDKLLQLKPNSMNVSMDGPREIHDKIRGVEGTFDKAVENLKYLRSKDNRMPIRMNCTVSYANKDYFKELLKIAKETNCDLQFTHLWHLDESVANAHNQFMKREFQDEFVYPVDSMSYTEDQSEEIANNFIELLHEAKKQGIKIDQVPMLKEKDIKRFYCDPSFLRAKKCTLIWSKLRLDSNGNLTPCLGYNFGNVLEQDFSKVLNSSKARKFRSSLKKHGVFPGCKTCEWL